MNFIAKNLLPNETILYQTQKHWIIFLGPLLWTIATAIFFFHPNEYVNRVGFVTGIASILFWLNQLLNYYFSEFAITNIRIMMREGFFFRHTNDTRLQTISNVTVNQNLFGQLFGFGVVYINTFGGEADPFTDIDNPVLFQKQLQGVLYERKPQN